MAKFKRILFLSLAAALISGGWLFLRNPSNEFEEEEEGGIPLQDRMDLAIQQEQEITKDLSTQSVPRERLIKAFQYAEQLRRTPKYGNQTQAALANVNWTERGPNNIGGRTRALLVDPNDVTKKTLWAGSVGGGLWKTTDITAATPVWTQVNDFFSNIAITSMASNPSNSLVMYFGTGEGFFNADGIRGLGIWKSVDGGANWSQLIATNSSLFYYVNRLAVHSSGDLYAATRSGIFRSQDGGTSFSRVLGSSSPGGANTDNFSDLEIGADGAIWASTMGSNGGVYRSASGNGGSWAKLNTGANGFPTSGFSRVDFALAPSNSNYCYAFLENSSSGGLLDFYKTTDGGANWTTCSKPSDADPGITNELTRTQAWYDMSIGVDPNDANALFVGGVDIFKSTNGGSSWSQITHWYGGFGFQNVHADQHIVLYEPGNSSVVYFGNDGGVFRSSNATAAMPTLSNRNRSYNVTQYYACAAHPTTGSNYFLAGAQDNGSHKFNAAGVNSVTSATGGDGCFCHIDQDQPQYQWTSYVYNNYYRSTNSGSSWTGVSFGNQSNGSFVNPTDYDNVMNIMYGGTFSGKFLRWNNPQSGNSFDTITVSAFNGGSIRHVAVSQNTPSRVFFGLSNGRIVRVDSARTAGSPIAGVLIGNPASGSVSCIAIENGDDNHILVTYSNYGLTSVWESVNALSATPTFTSVEGNLPDMPVRWALFSPFNDKHALLATEVGVWSTDLINGASTAWGPSSTGLANTRVDMLQTRTSDNLVVAATHGRGMFTSDIFMLPNADFAAAPLITYTNKPIQFSDGSSAAAAWSWDFGDGTTSSIKNPSHSYAAPGLYTVMLTINNNISFRKIRTGYVQVLPNKGSPYLIANGDAGNFDAATIDFGVENTSGTPFELGSSVIANKSGTASGTKAWVTGLAAATYLDNSYAALYCPNFNLTAAGTYTLSFYGKWKFEKDYDGFRIEYSFDKGTTWNILGGYNAASWYNFNNTASATAFPLNEPYFSDTSKSTTSFTKYSLNISSLAGNPNVAFRFVFRSDPSLTFAGLALDNFEVQGPPNTPLPVELLYFSGETKKGFNRLTWATASEINNRGFDLERSDDAVNFEKIGFVEGAGMSSEFHAYSYDDYRMKNSLQYYRLRQVDFDGKSTYSKLVALWNKNAEPLDILSVFPQPSKSSVSILFNKAAGTISIKIFDTNGKTVLTEQRSSPDNMLTVNLEDRHLSRGLYFMHVENEQGVSLVRKLLLD